MGTGISNRLLIGVALAAVLSIGGCGGASRSAMDQPARPGGAFAWLQPTAPPAGWTIARLPSRTAAIAYPPSWQAIQTDPGTVSAALLGTHGRIRGYLNVTPRSGAETLGNWVHFRPAHNRKEGDRAVVRDTAAVGLRFRSGSGSCVMDHYATVSARYREIACIVQGPRATNVVVAAAPPQDWPHLVPQLRRSIASFAS